MPWNETTKTQYTRPPARFENDLTDEEWILVEPCLPPPAKRGRPRETDLREVFNAIQYMRDTGCQWRAIPPCFPPAATVQQYFHLRRDGGVFARMMDGLRALGREPAAGQLPEEALDGFHPEAGGRRELEDPAPVISQPLLDGRVPVVTTSVFRL